MSSIFTRLLRSAFKRKNKPFTKPRKKPRSRLALEPLEARITPATFTWDGGGVDNDWTTADNWQGDVAPIGTIASNDNLIFPAGVLVTATENDFAGGFFNSITFAASGYSLDGNTFTLGNSIQVNPNAINNFVVMDIHLQGGAGKQQFFDIANGGDLTIVGEISYGAAPVHGAEISKEGAGTLTLTADNSDFTGDISVKVGRLRISDSDALGDTVGETTVLTNAQLELLIGTGTVNEFLRINGPGVANAGALLNVSGDNIWAGTVEMDSNSTIGATIGTSLEISGLITDTQSGHNLTKEGRGQVIFSNANDYRGRTTVADGVLTIRHPLALGDDGTATNNTVVNRSNAGKSATLQIEDLSGIGFTVLDEFLTLNDSGFGGQGALNNVAGNNTWAAPITLGSLAPNGVSVQIGVADSTELLISGVVGNPNGDFSLTKIAPGTLILDNANTYTSSTIVAQGILNIRDSQALGPSFGMGTTVINGATLQMEVDTGFDAHGRDLSDDSITGMDGNGLLFGDQLGLRIREFLSLSGSGVGNIGALHSLSGVNIWISLISMSTVPNQTAIGVDPDPAPSNTNIYFERDYSLTVLRLSGGSQNHNFRKVGNGHLILPNGNPYSGTTTIEQGWITIRDNESLGVLGSGSDISQPPAIVLNGAALHLKAHTTPAPAPALIHEYTLNATFADTLGGPSLVPNGGTLGATSYSFAPGQGLSLSNALPDPTNYSIEMVFNLNDVNGGYAALIDFKNRTEDEALYNLNGTLDFFPAPNGPGVVFTNNVFATLLITRDGGSGEVVGFVNGVEQWRFDDSATQFAVFSETNNIINFLQDNITGPFPGEESGGVLDNIRIYDGPLVTPSLTTDLDLVRNLELSGLGINHPFPLIGNKGALMNLVGDNTIGGVVAGRSSFIELDREVGIGVEVVDPGTESELTITAPVSGATSTAITFNISPSGGAAEDSQVLETGSTSGTIIVNYDMSIVADRLRIYYPPRNQPGSSRIFDTGLITGTGTINIPYGPGGSTQIEIVMNEGGSSSGTIIWNYTATVIPNQPIDLSGITKLGSKQLILQSEGSYGGDVKINEGVVLVQHDTALGLASSGTSDAASQNQENVYRTTATRVNEGISEVRTIDVSAQVLLGTDYTLDFGGDITGPISPTALASVLEAELNALPSIANSGGSVVVNKSGDIYTVVFVGSFTGTDVVTPLLPSSIGVTTATILQGDGAALRIGGLLDGSNIWHEHLHLQGNGNSEFGVSALSTFNFDNQWQDRITLTDDIAIEIKDATRFVLRGSIDDATNPSPTGSDLTLVGGGELILAGANSYRGTTLVTVGTTLIIQNSLALGSDIGGTIVEDGATLQIQGNLAVGNESLLLEGQGSDIADVPFGWFNIGPSPTNEWSGGDLKSVAGRITGSVVDPGNANVIYVATAGGGVWRTVNGGQTWTPLFDHRNGQSEVQEVTITGTPGTFTLTFDGDTTVPLATNADAQTVENALNSLDSIGGAYGSVLVTKDGNAYTITFSGNLAGDDVPLLVGAGDPGVVVTVLTLTAGINADKVMYVGAIAMHPSDPRTLYIGTGETNNSSDSFYGTGIYRSTDSGATWTLVEDTVTTPGTPFNPFDGKGISKIIIDPNNTSRLFVASGDGSVGGDEVQNLRINVNDFTTFTLSFTGPDATGTVVTETTSPITYNSTSSAGRAQTALNIQNALNALTNLGGAGGNVNVTPPTGGGFGSNRYTVTFGGALSQTNVSQLVGNPGPPPGFPSINISTFREGGGGSVVNGTFGNAGVWRFENGEWFNLTGVVSANRNATTGVAGQNSPPNNPASNPNPPGTPGPDDNYLVTFPEENATWSDVAIVYAFRGNDNPQTGARFDFGPVIYAALGTAAGTLDNGVFWTKNPETDTPIWYVGAPGGTNARPGTNPTGVDARSGNQFPVGWPDLPNTTQFDERPANSNIKLTAIDGVGLNRLIDVTVYASVAFAFDLDNPPNTPVQTFGDLRAVYKTSDGGHTWAALNTPNVLGGEGDYANAIVAQDANTVYVAGFAADGVTNHILRSTDGGTTWIDISTDINGVSPHTAHHGLTLVGGRLYVSNDGGLWRLENNDTWTNLTGNLTIAQINGVAAHPNDLSIAYAGIQSNGTARFDDSLAWMSVDGLGGGQVRVDPQNPNNVYAVQLSRTTNAVIRRSTDGGANWVTVRNTNRAVVPLYLDPINTSRLLIGGSTVFESLNGGGGWVSLGTPIDVRAIASATFQGAFVLDPDFTHVTDKGSNSYDPDTIYATDGDSIYVSKDHGLTWRNRTSNLAGLGAFSDILVDPRNRDTVYIVRNAFGGEKVFVTSDAGQTWNEINLDLPDIPVWSIVLDARTGDIFLGTDLGVRRLAAENPTTWEQFGNGMPNVQVRDLDLNHPTNTLLAGTYGRGVYQLFLDNAQPNSGALRAVSGISTWDGPVTLTDHATISVDGTQILDNNVLATQLTILGTISDQMTNDDFTITKTGGGDLIFAGVNTYGGETIVEEGVLAVKNPQALGESDKGTTVLAGAALELQSDLNAEPIFLFGDGQTFNDRNTGALRNFTGNNTYSGPLTLETNSTVGVDSGSSLTITGTIDDGVDSFNLVKELSGHLTLSGANTYDGVTRVQLGSLTVNHANALGSTTNGTEVFDGAQLRVSGDITVVDESLNVSGTGIFGTGAILNTGGDNIWQGDVTFYYRPNFAPFTSPPNFVSIGVAGGTSLTIDGVIGQDLSAPVGPPPVPPTPTPPAGSFGLTKVNSGRLILTQDNTYTGVTTVNGGFLNIQHAGALGTIGIGPNNGTIVNNGGALELEHATGIILSGEGLQVRGAGPGGTGALRNRGGDNEIASGVVMTASTTVSADPGTSLTISGVISQTVASNLTKVGGGTVILEATNTYTGVSNINEGTLQVDGQVGNVVLNGGTLGGTGTVGAISATGTGGTVNTGASPGILNADSAVWNSATTFFVELEGTTPGSGHDQLVVAGTIDLGNASLEGSVGAGVGLGDSFIIITAASVTGTFDGLADGDKFAFGGRIAQINYDTTFVEITIVQDDTTTLLESSNNPSIFSELVTFTATVESVIPGGVPSGDVEFYIDSNLEATVALVGGVATFDISTLTVGFHDVEAVYLGDGDFLGSTSDTVSQEVTTADTTTSVTNVPNPSKFGELVTFTVDVAPVAPGTGVPTGNVTFFDVTTSMPLAGSPVALDGSGQATLDISTLSVGSHNIQIDYVGDGNYSASQTFVTQVVEQSDTTTTLGSAPNPSVFGEQVTLTATVTAFAPGAGTPTGTVEFFDVTTSTVLSTEPLVAGAATFDISSLSVGTHDIRATYSGDTNFVTSQVNEDHIVNQATTTTTLGAAPNPSDFGQQVTFTATVTAVSPGDGLPTGTVTFFDVTTSMQLGSPVALDGSGQATLDISTLDAGSHTIQATYSGEPNFAGSMDSVVQVVNTVSTSTLLVSSENPSLPGELVTFTATVTGGPGTPTGNVTFEIDGGNTTVVALDSNGEASFSHTFIAEGSFIISAEYSGTPNLDPSSATDVTQVVEKASTSTVLVSSLNPSQPGDLVTFTATVTGGPGAPTGDVTFEIDGGNTTVVALDSNGEASFPHTFNTEGSFIISAEYSGSVTREPSSATDVTQVVEKAATTTVLASSQNPSVVGDTVTITATVSGPGTEVPTGTVTFTGTGAPGSPVPLDVNGEASFMVSTLTFGLHSYTAAYSGDARFDPSSDLTFTQDVRNDSSTTLVSSTDPSVFGQNVTFTATVTSSGGPQPTGDVNFVDTSTNTIIGTATLVGTQASFSTSSLAVGTHNIRADYVGDVNAVPSSSAPVDQDVDPASTATVVVGAPDPSLFAQEVTFTATISVNSPGAGTPTGTVNFLDGATIIGSDTVDGSGEATFATSTLTVGAHNITAVYVGDGNFNGSTSPIHVQDVNATPTNTTLGSNNNPSIFAFPVTFTVTVTNVGAGSTANPPIGTVQFKDGATTIGTKTLDGNGQATLTISTLTAGNHNITAEYLGGSGFAPSTSPIVIQKVNKAGTLSGLSTSGSPSDFGESVTFVASVAAPPSSGGPTGTITFRDGATILATVPVVGRLATFTTSDLSIGTHNIVAEYSGDANHLGAVSNTVVQRVIKVVRARLAVAADAGGGPHVRVFDPTNGAEVFSFFAYSPAYTGGVRLATGDVNNDGFDDIITGTGPGGGPHVKVFDGRTGSEIRSFFAYDASFTGGLYVASGDVNGDGFADIITGADAGGGPHVRITDGQTNNEIGSFFAFGGNFTGGVRVAAGDINADGRDEIIVGAGVGGGPRVRVIDGTRINQVQSNFEISNSALLRDFFAYNPGYTAGIFVSAGDTNGDGSAEITVTGDVTAPVRIFNGSNGALRNEFFPSFSIPPAVAAPSPGTLPKIRSGVVVGRGVSEIVLGQGAEVRVFDGNSLALLDAFFAFDPSFLGGIFIGV